MKRLLHFALAIFPATVFAAPLQWAIIGDAGDWNVRTQSVRDSIKKAGISRLILPGDNLYNTKLTYEQVWTPWREQGMTFDVVAIGNHTDGYRKERKYFAMPDGHYARKATDEILFLVLNSDDQYWEKLQINWLEKQLEKADQTYIFVVYHHPSLDVTSDGHRWKERHQFQRLLRPILFKHRRKLTALLVGHEHIAAQLHFDDLPVIVSGATHNPRKQIPVNNVQEGIKVKTDYFFGELEPFWVKLAIDENKNGAQIEFVRAKDGQTRFTSCLKPGGPAETGGCPPVAKTKNN